MYSGRVKGIIGSLKLKEHWQANNFSATYVPRWDVFDKNTREKVLDKVSGNLELTNSS
jgi:hypothetical protein